MPDIFPLAKKLKAARKVEETFGLISFPFLLLIVWGMIGIVSDYRSIVNNSGTFRMSKMKATYLKGAGYKGGWSSVYGYIIGPKQDTLDQLIVIISKTSVGFDGREEDYYDSKYEDIQVGDTIPVWYSRELKDVELVFPNDIEGLIAFRTEYLIGQFKTATKMLAVPFSIYFLSRRLRKYYQKRTSQL